MTAYEKYVQERKIQRHACYALAFLGLLGTVTLNLNWVKAVLSIASVAFSFVLIHTAYLGVKYSLVDLTTGVYTKQRQPTKYYSIIAIFVFTGMFFLFRVAKS